MRYPRYLLLLDAFGVAGACSALAYVMLPAAQRPEEHLDSLWGNLSTELIGIWVGVRFIEWIIRSHESTTKVRVRVVRNMRYVENLFHQALDFRRPYHLIQMHRELDWINRRLVQRIQHLKPDERAEVIEFYSRVQKLVELLPSRSEAQIASDHQKLLLLSDVPTLYNLLEDIESARYVAEKNILEETNEDDGI